MLIGKTFYTKPLMYLINEIFEYDMSKANISILYSKGLISIDEYNRLLSLDRLDRQISVGKMCKNSEVSKTLSDGFTEARIQFVSSNNISDNDILSIKKDALFITRRVSNLDFGNIHFRLNNYYQLYVYCGGLEIYFGDDGTDYIIDIKGISDDALTLHSDTYLFTLSTVLSMVLSGNYDDAVETWIDFMNKYVNKELNIEYYREFNSGSKYRLLNGYYIDEKVDDINLLNIGFNDNFNKLFHRVLTQIYFDSVRGNK